MSLSKLLKFAEEEKEWILTPEETTSFCLQLSRDVSDPARDSGTSSEEKKYVDRLKHDSRGCRIGSQTFASGLHVVLLEACRHGYMKVIRFLFRYKKHFEIDALVLHTYHFATSVVDVHPETTLVHSAARGDHVNVLEYLVSQGASVNVLDCSSLPPLLTALKRGASKAAMFLISAGANTSCANPFGQTSLMHALYCHSTDVMRVLIDAGADPKQCDRRGYNSLHHAVIRFDSKQVEFLLNIPDILSASGRTGPDALMLACIQEGQSASKTLEVLRRRYSQSSVLESLLLQSTTLFLKRLKEVAANFSVSHSPLLQECVDNYVTALCAKAPVINRSKPLDQSSTIYSEIETMEEFVRRIKVEDQKFVIAYQCIAIRERCLLGMANEAIIDGLFTVGMYLLRHNHNVMQGLYMWTRGSTMLLDIFGQHSTDVSSLSMLHRLLSDAVEYSLRVTYAHGCGSQETGQPRGFSAADLSPEEKRDVYLPILENLIDCLHLEIELDNRRHTHDRSKHDGCSKTLLGILEALSNLKAQKVDNIERMVAKVIVKCTWLYTYHTNWPQSILHLAVTGLSSHPQFIVLLLENGAKTLVNEPGHRGQPPLSHAIKTNSELIPILFQYGAHIDRVDANGDTSVNALNRNHFINLPLPLACLAAIATVREGIPYKELDIAPRLKTLVAHHDSSDVRRTIQSRMHLMTNSSPQDQ